MDLLVYLNGNFVKTSEAKVSIYDHGFLYGNGAFETLKVYRRHIFKFEEHIQRFHSSLKQIYMELPIPPAVIFKTIKLLLQHNQLQDAYIRITVTRGEGPIGLDTALCTAPTVLIIVEQVHEYPVSWYTKGISVVIVKRRKIPDECISSSIKSCNYLVNVLARREAQDKGAQEGILLNMEGYVAEGTVSNIFIVKDGIISTPALSSGVLDGITRRTVIELVRNKNMEVTCRHILPKEIFTADECFLTNTSMEIMPVVYCDGTQINKGKPGKITRQLMNDYKRLVEESLKCDNLSNT